MRAALLALLALASSSALARQEDPTTWPPLQRRFESTGGGGWMIDRYDPILIGDRCVTAFSAISPAGEEFRNLVLFDAVPMPGGTLCLNGRWRAEDGSNEGGTTPLRVFLRADGARFRSP
jgi:hypothetical protein